MATTQTTIQKRIEYIKSKHEGDDKYTDEKVDFLVRTGLTFDPSKIEDEDELYWLYPKGAGLLENLNPDKETAKDLQEDINKDPDPEVTSKDPETGEDVIEILPPKSKVTVVTGQDDDDEDLNPDPIMTADGQIVITND